MSAPDLRALINGFQVSRAIHVAVQLGLADRLADRPQTPAALAPLVDADPDALGRLMRALAAVGLFHEGEDGRFAPTPLGSGLCHGRGRTPTTSRACDRRGPGDGQPAGG